MAHDKNTSNAQKNKPAMITNPNTTAVVVAVSCRVGHTTLRSSSRVGLQLDGEFAGELPVTFTVLPLALRVIVP